MIKYFLILFLLLGALDVPSAWGQMKMITTAGYVDFGYDNRNQTGRSRYGRFTLLSREGPYIVQILMDQPAGVDIYSTLKLAWRRGWAVTVTGLYWLDDEKRKHIRVTGVYDMYGRSILKGFGINYLPLKKPGEEQEQPDQTKTGTDKETEEPTAAGEPATGAETPQAPEAPAPAGQ